MRKAINAWILAILLLPGPGLAAAPSLVLKDLAGRDRAVSEFIGHGRWVVVAVWASDCPICQTEMHHLIFFQDAHPDVNILGVSVDGLARQAQAQAFVDKQALEFPNLLGEPKQMVGFGAGPFIGTPTFYVFDPQGRLVGSKLGATTQEQLEALMAQGKPKP